MGVDKKASTKVMLTVIDDRLRKQLVDKCPFIGEGHVCNVNQTAQPACVGLDHEDCALRQYNSFRVEIPDSPKVAEKWRKGRRS